MGEKNEIIKHEAQNLDIKFPHNSKLTEKENLLPQKAIKETGIIDSKGKAYIGKKKIKDILVTDKAGANKFIIIWMMKTNLKTGMRSTLR